MSLAERRLPQYCCLRRHGRSFQPQDGKFLDNFTRFACFDCLRKDRRRRTIKKVAVDSTAEYEVAQELQRIGRRFRHHFMLGKWEFDFAFPDERLLLEIDGPDHNYHHQQKVDYVKTGFAQDEGWRVVRVKTGPGLIRRVAEALAGS